MGKPAVLTKLEKGKLLDAQQGFVETFNFLVDFINNLEGDSKLDENGHIKVDRTIPDFPVIKLIDSLGGGGIGGGSGGGFAYDEETMAIGPGAVAIGRQYIPVNQNGHKTDGEGDWRVEVHLDEGFAAVMKGDGFEEPTKTRSYIPLYQLSGGKVVVDYRGAPTVQAWEDYEE